MKESYSKLHDTYILPGTSKRNKEDFFVSYAVNGGIVNHQYGIRAGMPSLYPLYDSPVVLPSPLNTRWQYIPQTGYSGIF